MRNGLLLPAAFKERHLLSVIANTLYPSLIGQWSVTMPNRAAVWLQVIDTGLLLVQCICIHVIGLHAIVNHS